MFETFPDPSLSPSSLIEVEITEDKGNHFAIIHPCDVASFPFCVSNRSALDELILRQRHTSWDETLVVKPLQSIMWTLPLCDGEPLIDVYSRGIGLLLEASSFQPKFTFDATQIGDLGSFSINGERDLCLQSTVQKSSRFLVFYPSRKSNSSRQSSLIADKLILVDLQNHLDNRMLNNIPKSLSYVSFVQLMYCFAAKGIFPSSTSIRLDVQSDSQYRIFQSTRGSFPYFGKSILALLGSTLVFTLELEGSSTLTKGGKRGVLHGMLCLQDYALTDTLFEVVIPCYISDETYAFCVVHVANIPMGNEAQRFEMLQLQQSREEVVAVIGSITTEFKLERSFSRRNLEMQAENSLHLHRATHVGIWKSPSIASPVDIEEASIALTKQRTFLRLCVHEVKRLRNLPHKSMYFMVESRKIKQRSPSSSIWYTDLELQSHAEVCVTSPSMDFGCTFCERNGMFVVSQLLRNSLAARVGVCVGHVLVSIDGEPVPSTFFDLKQRVSQNTNNKQFLFQSLDNSFFEKAVMNQSVIVYDETLEFQETVAIHFFVEDDEKDRHLWSFNIDISEEKNMDVSVGESCISFETHWERFEEKEDSILEASIQIPRVGVSIVNSVPEEISFVSFTGISGKLQVLESGKQVVTVEMDSFQVDNQLKGATYSVILDTPMKAPWFSLIAKTQPNSSLHYLECFSVETTEIRLFIESGIIITLMEFVKELPLDLFDLTEKDCLRKLNENPLFIQ